MLGVCSAFPSTVVVSTAVVVIVIMLRQQLLRPPQPRLPAHQPAGLARAFVVRVLARGVGHFLLRRVHARALARRRAGCCCPRRRGGGGQRRAILRRPVARPEPAQDPPHAAQPAAAALPRPGRHRPLRPGGGGVAGVVGRGRRWRAPAHLAGLRPAAAVQAVAVGPLDHSRQPGTDAEDSAVKHRGAGAVGARAGDDVVLRGHLGAPGVDGQDLALDLIFARAGPGVRGRDGSRREGGLRLGQGLRLGLGLRLRGQHGGRR